MSQASATNTDATTRAGFKGGILGTLGGLATGIVVTAVTNAASGVANTLPGDISNSFTYLLIIIGFGIGFLEGSD